LTEFLIGAVAVLALLGLFQIFFLRGPDLRAFDGPVGQRHGVDRPPSASHHAVVASLGGISVALKSVPRRQHLAWLRRYMDTAFPLEDSSVRIIPANAGGVRGRVGVVARIRPGAAHALHPRRRLHDGQPDSAIAR
jgi:hypothetical protein